MKLQTVKGNENVADHLTKPKSKAEGADFMESFDWSWCWASRRRGGVHL